MKTKRKVYKSEPWHDLRDIFTKYATEYDEEVYLAMMAQDMVKEAKDYMIKVIKNHIGSWSYQQASEYIGRHQVEAYKRWEKRNES